jgi:mono/diheme cytochrome c family protein
VTDGLRKPASGWLGLALGLVLFLPGLSYSQMAPAQDPMAGSRVFGSKGCAKCHSINGLGGKIGPDLGSSRRTRSFGDVAAAMWNHLPQMVTEAKKRGLDVPHLNPPEVADLIGFLFTLNYFDGNGNIESGKKLFSTKRCIACHQIGGVGGVWGPNLDSVAQSGSPINIAAAMWNHGPAMAEAMAVRGINRPSLNASELRDLIAYLKTTAPQRSATPLSVLPGRAREGRELFDKKQCIKCHSVQGSGGNVGTDLGKRGLHRDLVDFAAALWNKAPAMLHAMKLRKVAVPELNAEEMADIVAYLRSFQYFGESGNAARGRLILFEKKCLTCHAAGGGDNGAPDLGRVKGLDSPAAVIAALWNHGGAMMQRLQQQNMPWPQLNSDDMMHLMAFFERTARSER